MKTKRFCVEHWAKPVHARTKIVFSNLLKRVHFEQFFYKGGAGPPVVCSPPQQQHTPQKQTHTLFKIIMIPK